MIASSGFHWAILTGTSHASAGTRSTVAHGLSYAPSVNRVFIQTKAADDDTNNGAAVSLVKVDSSYVYVKSTGSSTAFTLYIWKSDNEPFKFPSTD